jgi:uncharacterized membrane protein (UPF0127 family)
VANTLEEKTAGLESVKELRENEGMLFPFDPPQYITFHMGRVQYPIDILFISEKDGIKTVSKIIHDIQPGDSGVWSDSNIVNVLEVPGCTCKKTGISVGSVCKISDVISLG